MVGPLRGHCCRRPSPRALLQEAPAGGCGTAWTRPMGVLALPPRRDVPQRQLLGAFLLLLLIADVLPDDGLLEADGTHTVSPRPEMQPCEVACPPKVCAMNADSGFPFQPPDSICHTILGGNAQ